MSKIKHFKGFSVVDGDMKIKLNMSRFSRQYQEAQHLLDGMVMDSMIEFMPMISGDFINRTRVKSTSMQGTGFVCAAAEPYGRFLYFGKTMVDPATGSTWARHDAEKVLVSQYSGKTNAKENLEYTRQAHPQAQAEWFDAAKRQYGSTWIRKVKAQAGGGSHSG
nr:MAG TPA: Minor capsid protein [Caudoviricetes sp.]